MDQKANFDSAFFPFEMDVLQIKPHFVQLWFEVIFYTSIVKVGPD